MAKQCTVSHRPAGSFNTTAAVQGNEEPSTAMSQALRSRSESSSHPLTKEHFLKNAVGELHEVDIQYSHQRSMITSSVCSSEAKGNRA